MRTLESRMPTMISQLVKLANSATSYERYACSYIENLSAVNYSVIKRAWKRADKTLYPTFSKYVNSLLKGKLVKATAIV